MQIHYELVYEKGGNPENEDAYLINDQKRVFSVIDGATGLTGLSGKIAADLVKEELATMEINEPIITCIKRANKRLGEEVSRTLGVDGVDSIPKENRSTCGIAAIQIVGNQMEYVQAGDCMIFLRYKNKDIRFLTWDHVSQLDNIAIDATYKIIKERIKKDENLNHWESTKVNHFLGQIRKEVQPILIENRKKLNTLEGYGILDGSKDAIQFLDYGTISLQNVEQILLLTDGLHFPVANENAQDTWYRTAEFVFTNGLEKLKNKVLKMENADKACFTYPRLKFSDDKTGILLTLA